MKRVFEQDGSRAITVFDRAEAVRCPDCALAGIASFTNEQASASEIPIARRIQGRRYRSGQPNLLHCLQPTGNSSTDRRLI